MIDLARVDKVGSMQGSNSFIVEQGDGIRRIPLSSVRESLASSLIVPPSTFTLEGSSSPTFYVSCIYGRIYDESCRKQSVCSQAKPK